jgi:hypothetical protein
MIDNPPPDFHKQVARIHTQTLSLRKMESPSGSLFVRTPIVFLRGIFLSVAE